MKKKTLASLFCLLFCFGLLLALVSCGGKPPEETPEPSNDPPSVEIDDIDIDTAPGEDNDGIVVTPKDPNANVTILPGIETPAPPETATPTPSVTPSSTLTPKPAEKPVPASTPTPTPVNTPTPSVAPEIPPDIDTSSDVDIEADGKGSADISLEDLIDNSTDGNAQNPDESIRISDGNSATIGDLIVTPKDPSTDVVVTPKKP